MPRSRMIKPEFWSSVPISKISRDARLTFIGLWNFCDDYGFALCNFRHLLGLIYPYDEDIKEIDIACWIDELVAEELVLIGQLDGKRLLYVTSWEEHQRVDHKSNRKWLNSDKFAEFYNSIETLASVSRKTRECLAPKIEIEIEIEREIESNKSTKKKYADTVLMTDEEFLKIVEKVGTEDRAKKCIEILDNYKGSSGRKYKSDYKAILTWVISEIDKREKPAPAGNRFGRQTVTPEILRDQAASIGVKL